MCKNNINDTKEELLNILEDKGFLAEGGPYYECNWSEFEYTKTRNFCIIYDKNGNKFKITPKSLKKGTPLNIRLAVNKDEYTKYKIKLVHGETYNYPTKFSFVNVNTIIDIECKVEGHGMFQQRINEHILGHGCIKCAKQYTPTKAEFLWILKNKGYLDKQLKNCDWSEFEYIKRKVKSTIIDSNGFYHIITPNSLLKGFKLSIKSAVDKTSYIIYKFRLIHGDKYDYSLVKYVNNRTKVIIICPIHGIFEQIAKNHLQGWRCPLCASGGFKTNKGGYFYIIELEKDGRKGVGYGITNVPKHRMIKHKMVFKETNTKYNILTVYHFESGMDCLNMETTVKKHNTNVNFGIDGFRSECLEYDSKDYILNLLTESVGEPVNILETI